MIGLNYLLEKAGLSLSQVRLVRHQDARALPGRTPHELWMAGDGQFELYQRIQRINRFAGATSLVSFVKTPLNETLFVGVYGIRGVGVAPAGTVDPVHGGDRSGAFLYDTALSVELAEYVGRLVVDWGAGYLAWVQRADRNDKPIVEIRRAAIEPPFPGFTSFQWSIRQLSSVPSSWRGALSAVSGVYLLTCRDTGRQYVGSASGAGGFWSRWEDYFRTGHGGNQGMRLASGADFQVSILELAPSSLSEDDVVKMEGRWKDKLLSREFGLNRN